MDSFIQPVDLHEVFYIQDEQISSVTNKQDYKTFAIDADANLANIFKEIGEKLSQFIILPIYNNIAYASAYW